MTPIPKTPAVGLALALATVGGLFLPVLGAQEEQPRLGTVVFPASDNPAAQHAFVTGVGYLHSFEYDDAAKAFRLAQELEPDFVLAYWGEAMTYNHPVWDQKDRDAALAALARLAPSREARLAKARSPRDRGLLAAVEILYAEGDKAERDTAYSEAMARLAGDFPEDPEIRAFYALSLLGRSQGVRDVPTYMRAAAQAAMVFRGHPDHPGAAHYLIHAFDDPTHAPLGLPAARAYSEIAPDAAHAQHMTTHIFLAMGMWAEVVSQNTLAANQTSWGPGHYTAWLTYGLGQQGRHRAADSIVAAARDLMRQRNTMGARGYLITMRAHRIITSEAWDHPALSWTIDSVSSPEVRAVDAFTRGFAALRRLDRAAAAEAQAALAALPADESRLPEILAAELGGLLLVADGETDSGIATLRQAAAIEDGLPVEFGPPMIVKPTHELLGEVLLAAGRTAEAEAEFERALASAPGRSLSLRGLARAATAAGNEEVARKAYGMLRANWDAADPGLAGLAEARAAMAGR